MSNLNEYASRILSLIDFKNIDIYSTKDINLIYDKYLNELESIQKKAENNIYWNSAIQLQSAIIYASIKNHQEYLKLKAASSELPQINKVKDALIQIDFLISILRNLPSKENTKIIEYAVKIIKNITDVKVKASKFREILPFLTTDQHNEVAGISLDIINNKRNKENKAYVISQLAPYLPKLYIYEALKFYKNELIKKSDRLNFEGLIPYINETSLNNLLIIIERIEEDSFKAKAINKLIPNTPKSFYEKLLNIIKTINDDRLKSDSLRYISKLLPPDTYGIALDVVKTLSNAQYKELTLRFILTDLPTQFVKKALDVIKTMEHSKEEWVQSFSYLSSHISANEIENILKYLFNSKPSWIHVTVLKNIISYVTESSRKKLSELIFIKGEVTVISSGLTEILAPYLSQKRLLEILKITGNTNDTLFIPSILKGIIPHLSQKHLQYLLDLVKSIKNKSHHIEAIYQIYDFIPSEQQENLAIEAFSLASKEEVFKVISLSRSFSIVYNTFDKQQQIDTIQQIFSALKEERRRIDPIKNLMPVIDVIERFSDLGQNELLKQLTIFISPIDRGALKHLNYAWEKSDISDLTLKRKCWYYILKKQSTTFCRSSLLKSFITLEPILLKECKIGEINNIVETLENVSSLWTKNYYNEFN